MILRGWRRRRHPHRRQWRRHARGRIGRRRPSGWHGIDTISYEHSSGAVSINLATNTASGADAAGDTVSSIEAIRGSAFGDVLIGSAAANNIFGDAGDDALSGGAGADTLDGGAGVDLADYSQSAQAVSVDLFDRYRHRRRCPGRRSHPNRKPPRNGGRRHADRRRAKQRADRWIRRRHAHGARRGSIRYLAATATTCSRAEAVRTSSTAASASTRQVTRAQEPPSPSTWVRARGGRRRGRRHAHQHREHRRLGV